MDGWNVGNYFPFGESLCSKAILVSRSVVFFKFLECTCCASGWVAWTWWWSQCLENNQPISSLWTGSKSTQKSLGWGHDIQTCSKSISTIHGRHVFKLKKHTTWKIYHASTPMTLDFLQTASSSPYPAIFWLADLRKTSSTCGWTCLIVPNIAKVWSWTVFGKVRPLVYCGPNGMAFPWRISLNKPWLIFEEEGIFEVSTWGNGPFFFQLQLDD